jgi:hypothetical protein
MTAIHITQGQGMSDEWGDWHSHDGLSGPRVEIRPGDTVNLVGFNFDGTPHDAVGIWEAWHATLPQWSWRLHGPDVGRVTRYRIRKPRALIELIEMVENLPAPVQPTVDA